MTAGPDDDGLTDDERTRYVDRMVDRYGSAAAERIGSGPEPVDLGPGVTLGDRRWADEHSLVVTDSSGDALAESDNYAAVYENVYPSSMEEDRYVYWLWSAARPADGCVLRECWSHVDLSDSDVLLYDPGGDRQDNGTIGPHPERTGMDDDEFAVRWRGEHAGVQVVTASLSEGREPGAPRAFEWSVHLAGEPR
ncbi:hypothetical protein [Halovivax cerinus]|uniref:Uncharacterized protein n=1 Tax=Halovivax cerinus TaxID=1487865 RepID=A0ABD5NTC6_9EURY|nr:hypothetical protein [Halovivax cerinus]